MYYNLTFEKMQRRKINLLASILVAILFYLPINRGFAQGINFLGGTYQAAVETAKRSNKILFVEVYLTGCPHCAALAPVLEEKKVGDLFNSNFVSYKLEANSDDSKRMQQQKGITYVEFPLFFFFDPNSGQLIHQAAPTEQPNRTAAIEEVLRHGKDAIDPSQRTIAYAGRFAKGDRDLLFLVNYGKYAKATKDSERQWQINNELAKIFVKPNDLESANGFYIIQRLINDFSNPMAQYFFANLNKYKSKYPAKDVQEAGETILYYTLYGRRADELSANEVIKVRQAFMKLGLSATVANTRTILKELEAYFRAKETGKATARLNEHSMGGTLLFADYAYLVRYFNEKATDNSYVPSLIQWVNNGLKLVKPNERNKKEVADIYVEQAKAYLKIRKNAEAKKAAQAALGIAQAAKIDTKPYLDQLAKIK